MNRTVDTILGELNVQKGKHGTTSPSEEAAVAVMVAQGTNNKEIADTLERSKEWVSTRRRELAGRIEDLRFKIREPLIEDYTDILMLSHLEWKERLIDDERRAKIKDKDLVALSKAYFNMLQLMNLNPTQITEARESHVIDLMVIANQTDENFEAAMRALIVRKGAEELALPPGEVIDVELDGCDGNGNGSDAH